MTDSAVTATGPRVIVLMFGLMHLAACAADGVPADEVTGFVNAEHPTGISSPWTPEEKFTDGESVPAPCEQVPGRQHYLFTC